MIRVVVRCPSYGYLGLIFFTAGSGGGGGSSGGILNAG